MAAAAGMALAASASSLVVASIESGAMPFGVSHEIIPETHRKGHPREG